MEERGGERERERDPERTKMSLEVQGEGRNVGTRQRTDDASDLQSSLSSPAT